MGRSKIKRVKTVKQGGGDALQNAQVVDMFNQMLGVEKADVDIIIPKYDTVVSKSMLFAKIITAATEDVFMKSFPEQIDACNEILKYASSLQSIEFIDTSEEGRKIDGFDDKLRDHYVEIKKNNLIKTLIMTCKNLIEFKPYLSKDSEFDDSFILRIPGLSFCPFPFSSLDIKQMWLSDNMNDGVKKYVLQVLKISMSNTLEVYNTLTSPDVDVEEFSEIIISSITKVKKLIPRCDKAFAKIEESIGLLQNNFSDYYKDFVQSQNPSTIIESFVIDVSNTGGADVQTAMQFKKIIDYYRKATQGKIKDPKIKKVFDMLNDNINMMVPDDEACVSDEEKNEEDGSCKEKEEEKNEEDGSDVK